MKNSWTWFAGLAAVLVFGVLFSIRLGYFSQEPKDIPKQFQDLGLEMGSESQTFMNILQNGRKIGYAISTIQEKENGFMAGEMVYMELAAMGTVQKTIMNTAANLNPDMTLDSMTFQLSSDMVSFSARAWMEGPVLKVRTGKGEDESVMEFPMKSPPMIDAGLTHTQGVRALKPGERISYPMFDPATMGNWVATITMVGKEAVRILDQDIPAKKLEISFMGQTQTAWISEDGQMLAQEGLLGLRLEKTSRLRALDEETIEGAADLIAASAVPVTTPIMDPESLTLLSLRAQGVDESFAKALNEGRQTYSGGVLTVRAERLPDSGVQAPYADDPAFLQPDAFIQSGHPEVVKMARDIVDGAPTPLEKTRRIIGWAYKELEKRPVFSLPQALDTLRNKAGDCNEHAILAAALARAAGVPARIDVGLYYLDGSFYYHAWNSFFVGGQWISGDATRGQFPSDVAHLRFAQGGPEAQLEVTGLMGRLKLEVLEQKK